jgi:hypothetical protein
LLVIAFSVFVQAEGVVYRLALIRYSRKAIQEYYKQQNQPNALLIHAIKTPLEQTGGMLPYK